MYIKFIIHSPRGLDIEGEEDSWDFGTGAGFYVDATESKFSPHYNMYTYVTQVHFSFTLIFSIQFRNYQNW